MKQKSGRKLLSFLLALAMVVGLVPGMSMTAYAEVAQSGENNYVKYSKGSYGFNVQGKKEDGSDIPTTFSDQGYTTRMKVGENDAISFSSFEYGKSYDQDGVSASITAQIKGKSVLITYSMTNNSTEEKTVKIGSSADTQIGTDDSAPVSFTDNGLSMKSSDGKLEFKLIPGDGNFTTRWYGEFYNASSNVFNNREDTSEYTGDSGIAWSWTVTIPAGETVVKTAALSAGESGTTAIAYEANGGTGEMEPTVETPDGEAKTTLRANTFTREGFVFKGWDTNSAGTNVVYADQAEIVIPDTDITLYAVWQANPQITAAAEDYTVTYDGEAHGITVNVTDPAAGATVRYRTEEGSYTLEASPTITDVADSPLTVYYQITADDYLTKGGSAVVTINKADPTVTAPAANTLTYTGEAQKLVGGGTATGGEMQYALGTDDETAPTDGWSADIPTGTDVGTYYVWYKVKGDANHNGSEPIFGVSVTVGDVEYYEQVPLTAGAVKDITGTEEAPKESNPYGTKIVNSASVETLLKVTDTEKADGVNVWLDIQDGTATVSTADKTKIQSAAGEYTVGQYLDVNLWKKVGDAEPEQIFEPNGKVKISIVIPASLRKDGRTFRIIKVHNGEASVIDGTYDTSAYTFTFETDGFSSYAIAYKDGEEKAVDEPAQTTPVATTVQPRAPKTNDGLPGYGFWLLLMAAGIVISAGAGFGRKKEN